MDGESTLYKTGAERFKVILESVAFVNPDMPLHEALPMILAIEAKTVELDGGSEAVLRAQAFTGSGGFIVESTDVHTVAAFCAVSPDIIAHLDGAKKINAIKEVRARLAAPCPDTSCSCQSTTSHRKHYTRIGLKEAKEGVEHFERTRHA